MNTILKSTLAAVAVAISAQAAAGITFYEREDFRGQSFTTDRPVRDLDRFGFNNRASSAVVSSGRWEVCEDSRFRGRCVVLRQGSYESLSRDYSQSNYSSSRLAILDDRDL